MLHMLRINFLYFACYFFVASVLHAQDIDILDKDKAVKKRVRTVTLFEYDYVGGKLDIKGIKAQTDSFDNQGQKLQQINFRNDGSIMTIAYFSYDNRGNKTQTQKFAMLNNKPKLEYAIQTKYDSKGNKLQEIGFNGVDSFKNVYNYNKQGQLAEVNFFIKRRLDEKRIFENSGENIANLKILDGFGTLKYMQRYTYSKTGKVLEETRIENDNSISQKIVYTYDKNDMLTTETRYFREKLVHKLYFIYETNNKISEVYKETPSEGRFLLQKFTYDDNGMIKEYQWREENNKEFSRNIYTYESNGLCKTIDSYYARYKRQVLSVFIYTFY